MSTAAVKKFPVVSGATAKALQRPETGRPAPKQRTPLSVVRSAPRKRRAPFVVMCFALLALALVAVLVLNISVSTAQYQLVQLRSAQTALTKQNQDLTQQIQHYDAPQNLAAKATELGMVASTGKGQIDLSTLTVTGDAKPAAKGENKGAVIPAPAVAGQLEVVPRPTTNDPLENRAPAGGAANAPEAAPPASAAPAAPAPAQAPAQAPAPVQAPAPAADLHGGSIPAPQQKSPGR